MRRPTLLAAAAIVLAVVAFYVPTLDDYFTQDDFGVVSLLSQKSVTDLPGWFVSTWMDDIWGYTPDEVRPFPALSYQLASLAGPAWPAPNHVINVALHAANALLVFFIARTAAGVALPAACAGALVFALMPNQAESVAWVTGRVDSLPALFYFGSFLAYVRQRTPLAWLLCFVALFSKQNTITLVPALVLYDLIVARRVPGRLNVSGRLKAAPTPDVAAGPTSDVGAADVGAAFERPNATFEGPDSVTSDVPGRLKAAPTPDVAAGPTSDVGAANVGAAFRRPNATLERPDSLTSDVPGRLKAAPTLDMAAGPTSDVGAADVGAAFRRPNTAALWAWMRPYVPFALMTAGYLALRYVLFDQVVRESLLTSNGMRFALGAIADHVARLVIGTDTPQGAPPFIMLAGTLLLMLTALGLAWRRLLTTQPGRAIVYFGLVWTALGLAPALVAGYASPRHAYLASLGVAVAIALALDAIWRARTARVPRLAAGVGIASVLLANGLMLRAEVVAWGRRAAISAQAVADLQREAGAAPPGSLLIAGVPPSSWAWAMPFAARPPFAMVDVLQRVSVITHSSLDCCGAEQGAARTRRVLAAWLARPDRPPVIALYWEPRTGRLSRLSERDDPSLRTLMRQLADTPDGTALDSNISRLLTDLVAFRGSS